MARKGIDRQTVLEAAVKIIDTEGFENLSMAALAKTLGIKTPSLYNHVKGMSDLRKQLAVYGINRLKETMAEASIGLSGKNAIFSLGTAYVSFVREHPGLYEATLPSASVLDEEILHAGEGIVNLLLRVLQDFHLEHEDAIHAVRGLRSLVHGFASLELKNGFNMELDVDVSFKHLLETYVNGIERGSKKNK
ncbi:TetR/AcrR family transcriptional regulator [Pseudalkalibacillus caeni]|uniref:TetR/AcrR family transcriptional regulator n=1 Tax=Exobacillus caeni TaxID=2574798 RepID=A0A5R9F7E5_9BACL|nr:TetR/AcrR family transcriptional regulator [Pseudalkalibacillus caeni]TLS36424.1 TetR/AcrR family transcriptional regulator [Pseudalkalibacillus caeni]